MPCLELSSAEVSAIRRVLMVDDVVYQSRMTSLLMALHRLLPSDCLGFCVADRRGCLTFHIDLPEGVYDRLGPQACDGPLHVGVEHLAGSPMGRAELACFGAFGLRDCLRVGFPLGEGRVAQFWFDRYQCFFEARHVELLSMLQPALARQVRPPDDPGLLAFLSDAERHVLDLVSRGASNQDVAAQLSVSEATVRKHLEHVYRKLGVTNRTAASALVRATVPG